MIGRTGGPSFPPRRRTGDPEPAAASSTRREEGAFWPPPRVTMRVISNGRGRQAATSRCWDRYGRLRPIRAPRCFDGTDSSDWRAARGCRCSRSAAWETATSPPPGEAAARASPRSGRSGERSGPPPLGPGPGRHRTTAGAWPGDGDRPAAHRPGPVRHERGRRAGPSGPHATFDPIVETTAFRGLRRRRVSVPGTGSSPRRPPTPRRLPGRPSSP